MNFKFKEQLNIIYSYEICKQNGHGERLVFKHQYQL